MTTQEMLTALITETPGGLSHLWPRFFTWEKPERYSDESVFDYQARIGRQVRAALITQLANLIDHEPS